MLFTSTKQIRFLIVICQVPLGVVLHGQSDEKIEGIRGDNLTCLLSGNSFVAKT